MWFKEVNRERCEIKRNTNKLNYCSKKLEYYEEIDKSINFNSGTIQRNLKVDTHFLCFVINDCLFTNGGIHHVEERGFNIYMYI